MVVESVDIGALEVGNFQARIGQPFTLSLELGGPELCTLTLDEATTFPTGRPGGRVPFSLVLSGPKDVALPQHTYWLEHGQMGSMNLFLVPIGADNGKRQYQAIFN